MYQPVIIIGAARSGTNMLRDVLTTLPGFATWPCDEINYVWRYGNARFPLDELTPEHARPAVAKYIRGCFDQLARQHRAKFVIEKTCANSLRVPFVDAVIPNARYLFIVRDGRDVVASARKCWQNPIDLGYILKKARFVPWRDVPYYGSRYLFNRLYHLWSGKKRLAFWGPRFEGMDDVLQNQSLEEVCAHQWRRSVQLSAEAFSKIGPARVHTLRYEHFVSAPAEHLQAICEFLNAPIDAATIRQAVSGVNARSVGNWKKAFSADQLAAIESIMQPVLQRWGYSASAPAGAAAETQSAPVAGGNVDSAVIPADASADVISTAELTAVGGASSAPTPQSSSGPSPDQSSDADRRAA